MTFEWVVDVVQIIFADIILSGDNALVIGMAAAGLSPELRKRAIFIGMMMAAGMRILFAVGASFLIGIKGVLLVGGLLLAWVCWRFYKDIQAFNEAGEEEAAATADTPAGEVVTDAKSAHFRRALITILIADISMSIDNILVVAAIARENTTLLVFGLALAIAMMAIFATLIMKIMLRYRWLSYLGLVFLVYLTGTMLYDGLAQFGFFGAMGGA